MPTQTEDIVTKRVSHKSVTLGELFAAHLEWKKSDNPIVPFFTTYKGIEFVVRLNEFPDENLYTLIGNDETIDFDDWPVRWKRP